MRMLTGALVLWAGAALAADPVGQIKSLEGSASVIRAGAEQALAGGEALQADDVLVTKAGSTLGIVFRDDTTLAMGPSSRLVIDRLLFQPAASQLDLGLSFDKGTFSVQSGQIAKLAPERTNFRTPTASLAIRGTSFLVKVDGNE
ncbi:conserved exported hypothetical protein [Magnetospirillum sp. LM-5]|uniref:FecR family protein n=1 Tax=Magnetospirillum sp. LM-5 TaxID=2681466 RepID=UPI0013818693|nr:FecR domain-containing protein [Magnetospirillum sp. LM-5]CAA7611633.1 conserved exported hypothetical protein [Magnetospirillum sp. LM-5]